MRARYRALLLGLLGTLVAWGSSHSYASPSTSPSSPCTLSSVLRYESDHPQGSGLYLWLSLDLKPGWKVYAPPQGATGYPPRLTLNLPGSTAKFQVFWPPGVRFKQGSFQAWVYERSVQIPVRLEKTQGHSVSTPFKIQGTLSLLACSETLCVPLNLPVEATAEISAETTLVPSFQTSLASWLFLCGLAVLGGFILHLMPCVLPVLSLKLVQMIHMPPHLLRAYYGGSFLGIQGLFLSTGIIFALMKWGGTQLGWGMHFQNPWVVMLLCAFMVMVCAQLWGWRALTLPLWITQSTWGERVRSPWVQGMAHGILMTLLATPCTAPFLGTALGVSLAQHAPWPIMVTFGCIGLGFGLPYLILMNVPASRLPLPKPGLWMVRLKFVASLGIVGVMVWLGYLAWTMVPPFSFVLFLMLMLVLVFLLKAPTDVKPWVYRMAIGAGALMGMALMIDMDRPLSRYRSEISEGWVAFEEQRFEQERMDRPVLLNVTARWCVTCHVNQRVWRDPMVQNFLKQHNVMMMEGDITQPHAVLEALMHRHQRAGVPFSVIYTPQHPEGLVFSELLTVQNVLDTLKASSAF